MKIANERRVHARQVVVPNRASLDWGSTTTDGGRDARMLDISRGGASLESREVPPAGQPVWLRLEHPAATPWVNATVVRREGRSRVGVQFESGCPEELMLAATLGISLVF